MMPVMMMPVMIVRGLRSFTFRPVEGWFHPSAARLRRAGLCATQFSRDTGGNLPDEPIVGARVTEDPASAMEIHHYRQNFLVIVRANDAHTERAFWADRKRRVLYACVGLGDGNGLGAGQRGASICRR